MKSFLTKLVNPYVMTSLVCILVFTMVLFFSYVFGQDAFNGETLFSRAMLFITLPAIALAFMADPYVGGVFGFEGMIYQALGLILFVLFSAFIWSLPVWGIIYIVQRLRKTNTV